MAPTTLIDCLISLVSRSNSLGFLRLNSFSIFSVTARFVSLALLFLCVTAGCRRAEPPPSSAETEATPDATPRTTFLKWRSAPTPTPAPTAPPPPEKIWEKFVGDRAFGDVRAQVEFGPRPAGSEALEQTRQYLEHQLDAAGWSVERQTFTNETPRGPIEFVNLIGRFRMGLPQAPGDTTQKVILASHYDTKLFDTINFVGAHDGASSTGALLEIARVLSLNWTMAKQVELVFFDGEEAISQFSATDGLYGSRHYAEDLRTTKRNRQFKFGILLDMIGDADLTITLPPDSPADIARGIFASATRLGVREKFRYLDRPILDDHIPLTRSGIPTIDLIDFDYEWWHTADDKMDKLSSKSLQTVGSVTLYYLWTQLGLGLNTFPASTPTP